MVLAAILIAVVVIFVVLVAVNGKKQLSHTAVEGYVAQQYNAQSVSCNGGKNFTLKTNATFTCTASGGQSFTVTIKNKKDGSYQVVKN